MWFDTFLDSHFVAFVAECFNVMTWCCWCIIVDACYYHILKPTCILECPFMSWWHFTVKLVSHSMLQWYQVGVSHMGCQVIDAWNTAHSMHVNCPPAKLPSLQSLVSVSKCCVHSQRSSCLIWDGLKRTWRERGDCCCGSHVFLYLTVTQQLVTQGVIGLITGNCDFMCMFCVWCSL